LAIRVGNSESVKSGEVEIGAGAKSKLVKTNSIAKSGAGGHKEFVEEDERGIGFPEVHTHADAHKTPGRLT
jgi:hypothetical protein